MRITLLHGNPQNYSCNAYLVRGDSNEREDVNSLVDVGIDGSVCGEIDDLCTGIGKKRVAQVVLTHGHYDHAAGLGAIVACYRPKVCAFAPGKHVDVLLIDGQFLRLGDREFEVMHTPGHSEDSICLYCARDRTLFAGDMPFDVKTPGGSYPGELLASLERIASRDVATIYAGHASPVISRVPELLRRTIRNIRQSTLSYSYSGSVPSPKLHPEGGGGEKSLPARGHSMPESLSDP
jgi:glyoxylase-like metal-dependent hydrolase (beta-lactamase superfamily II)